MKKIIGLLVLVGVALVGFNFYTTGTFGLPWMSGSTISGGEEGATLNRLRGEFRVAAREYRQAGQSAAVSGLDTTDAAAAAMAAADRVAAEVERVAAKASSQEIKDEAAALLQEIKDWKTAIQ